MSVRLQGPITIVIPVVVGIALALSGSRVDLDSEAWRRS